MLNTEEYSLFLQANCLKCKNYKGYSEDNCAINKKIELCQHLEGVAAEAIFPIKYLKEVPQIQKYSCKKMESKIIKEVKRVADKVDQIKMF
jgi:hypothetical protein